MEKPTLEEVKEYFKNAETIESLLFGDKIKIDGKIRESTSYLDTSIYHESINGYSSEIWNERRGYAKILTYKKPEFRPVAMRCTREQFEAVSWEDLGLKIEHISKDWGIYNYLVNNYRLSNNVISNVSSSQSKANDREIHETWNEKVFLEYCGIEVKEEEAFVITKEQICNLFNTYGNDKNILLEQYFPQAFEEDKKELPKDFTGWCKTNEVRNEKWLAYFENGVYKYGIDSNGEWHKATEKYLLEGDEFEATPQEVAEALEKEAVRMGFKENVYVKGLGNTQNGRFYYNPELNYLYCGGYSVFCNGIWNEIIKKITIKEAEEKLNNEFKIV